MTDESWATFSIYDHRTPIYRRALLLFDRIVVPVPARPVGSLLPSEIDELSADVAYLAENEAAVRFDWDPVGFQSWQQSVASEALARTLNQDRQFASRLFVAQEYTPLIPAGVESVTAVPVYHDPKSYDASAEELRNDVMETALLEIVLPRLPIPDDDVPLESIVAFRKKDQFSESLHQVRKWQKKILPELLSDDPEKRARNVRVAASDFDRWIRQYSEAMVDAKIGKAKTAVVSVLAVGAVLCPFTTHLVAALSAIASPLFSIRELSKPCWKVVNEKECAPAAMVYAAAHLQ